MGALATNLRVSPQSGKKVVLFPEISRVKNFLSLTRPHSRICIRICVFNFKKIKPKIIKIQKTRETKNEKRISMENVTGYDDIVCKLLCVLLTYLIEWWIYRGCSYEFNVVYMKREKSWYLLYYKNIWSTYFQEQK